VGGGEGQVFCAFSEKKKNTPAPNLKKLKFRRTCIREEGEGGYNIGVPPVVKTRIEFDQESTIAKELPAGEGNAGRFLGGKVFAAREEATKKEKAVR